MDKVRNGFEANFFWGIFASKSPYNLDKFLTQNGAPFLGGFLLDIFVFLQIIPPGYGFKLFDAFLIGMVGGAGGILIKYTAGRITYLIKRQKSRKQKHD